MLSAPPYMHDMNLAISSLLSFEVRVMHLYLQNQSLYSSLVKRGAIEHYNAVHVTFIPESSLPYCSLLLVFLCGTVDTEELALSTPLLSSYFFQKSLNT